MYEFCTLCNSKNFNKIRRTIWIMENLVQLAPIITALTALLGTLIQQHYASEKRLREEREQNNRLRELEGERHTKEIELIRKSLQEQNDYHREEIESLKDGTKALIRNDILDICREAINKRYIDIYTLETLNGLYDSYKVFEGNSTVEDLYLEAKSLPILDERDFLG